MDSLEKRRRIQRYFRPFPRWPGLSLLISGAFLVGGLFNVFFSEGGSGLILLGAGLSGPGLCRIFAYYRVAEPTVTQIDGWIEEDLQGLQEQALRKGGVPEAEQTAAPVFIRGLPLRDLDDPVVHYRKGRDGLIRFTPIRAGALFFTGRKLWAYICEWDLLAGRALYERVDGFPYGEGTAITSQWPGELLQVNGKRFRRLKMDKAAGIAITAAGGTALAVPLVYPEIIEAMGGGELATQRAGEVIAKVQAWLDRSGK